MIINAIAISAGASGGSREPIVETIAITENGTYKPNEGVDGFNPVEVNVQPPLQTKSIEITANGQSTIEADSGYYGLESVGLNVNVQPNLQTKSTSTTITSNGTSTITLEPDSNYDGLSSASVDVNVNVPIPTFETEELNATANGTYTPSTDGFSKVDVNVQPNLQSKSTSQTITANGTSTITLQPDSNYDGLSSASVTITTNVESSGSGKYVVPNGMKFGGSSAFNAEDFDVSQVTDMSLMFNAYEGAELDLSSWDVTNVRKMDYLVANSTLSNINLSNWNMSAVTSINGMFQTADNLWIINMDNAILPKMNLNLGLEYNMPIRPTSLVSVLNALPQLSSGESYTCTIGSDNLAKLSNDQKAIATNKGWTLE